MLIDPRVPVLVSMALIAYQDFRFREVVDWAYLPALLFLALGWGEGWLIQFAIAVATLAMLSICLYLFGAFSSADAIVLPLIAFDKSIIAPMFSIALSAVPMAADLAYAYVKRGGLSAVVSPSEALKGPWVPKCVEYPDGKVVPLPRSPEKALEIVQKCPKDAKVHCGYGVPLAGYLAVGYILKFFIFG